MIMSNIRTVVVDYSLKVPGLDVQVPMRDRFVLEDGYSDEDSLPAMIAIATWGKVRLDHLVTVKSVRPALRKAYGPGWGERPSETTLAERRGWSPYVDGESSDASVWRAQHGGLLQRSNDPGCLSAAIWNQVNGLYAR